MNKNIITIIGFILIAIIGYQSYLLKKNSIDILPKHDKPKITVNIEKKSIEDEVKKLNQPKQQIQAQTEKQPKSIQNLNPNEIFDQIHIKEDINKLFTDIFNNPKIHEGIQKSIQQLQKGLEDGLKQMNQQLNQFQTLSQNGNIFKDILGDFANANRLKFTDKGDEYYLKINVPGKEKANIDIKTKANLLILTITQKEENNNTNIHSESLSKQQNILLIPNDAFVEQLQTKYKDGILEITIPKVKKVSS